MWGTAIDMQISTHMTTHKLLEISVAQAHTDAHMRAVQTHPNVLAANIGSKLAAYVQHEQPLTVAEVFSFFSTARNEQQHLMIQS